MNDPVRAALAAPGTTATAPHPGAFTAAADVQTALPRVLLQAE